jgi:hypothetical protein
MRANPSANDGEPQPNGSGNYGPLPGGRKERKRFVKARN